MMLQKIDHALLCNGNTYNCVNTDHHIDVEIYYEEIVHSLNEASKVSIPRIPQSALKHYWSVTLDELKHESCMTHDMWVAAGKPRSGSIFEIKQDAHYKYKLAIRDAAKTFESQFTDDLLELYMQKDMNSFWRSWKSKNNSNHPFSTDIEG